MIQSRQWETRALAPSTIPQESKGEAVVEVFGQLDQTYGDEKRKLSSIGRSRKSHVRRHERRHTGSRASASIAQASAGGDTPPLRGPDRPHSKNKTVNSMACDLRTPGGSGAPDPRNAHAVSKPRPRARSQDLPAHLSLPDLGSLEAFTINHFRTLRKSSQDLSCVLDFVLGQERTD